MPEMSNLEVSVLSKDISFKIFNLKFEIKIQTFFFTFLLIIKTLGTVDQLKF